MEIFILACFLGLIPAFIAQNKGRSFGLWYVYGVALFIVALIHSLCISKRPPKGYIECPFCKEFIKKDALICPHCRQKVHEVNTENTIQK